MARSITPYLTYLKTILSHNPSKDLPYHNNEHMVGVWDTAQMLYTQEAPEDDSEWRVIQLLFACLLHDYNHSGGKYPDAVNIENAVQAVIKTVNHCPLELPTGFCEVVTEAIRCTQYPFTRSPNSLLERVLRDADLLQATLSGDPKVIMEGLRQELQVSQAKDISYLEMYEQQLSFASGIYFYTLTGVRLWVQNKERFLTSLETYVNTPTTVVH